VSVPKREKPASEIEEGEIVKVAGAWHRVVHALHHRGIGQAAGVSHLKLKPLAGAAATDRRYRPDEPVETLPVAAAECEFLFGEGGRCTFMNVATFEQFEVADAFLGAYRRYLVPNQTVEIEFDGETPIAARTPAHAVLEVVDAPPGQRGDTEAGFKPARLSNGLDVQVPPFIEAGDRVKVEVETGRYVERERGAEVRRKT
jgi:elongation factor P